MFGGIGDMLLAEGKSKKWMLVWHWPQDHMAWFFWGYRSLFYDDTGYRVGPITLWVNL